MAPCACVHGVFRVVDRQCVGAWQASQVTCGYSTLRGVKSLQRSVFALVPPSKPVFHFLFPWRRDPSLYFARLALVRCWFAGGRSWSVIWRRGDDRHVLWLAERQWLDSWAEQQSAADAQRIVGKRHDRHIERRIECARVQRPFLLRGVGHPGQCRRGFGRIRLRPARDQPHPCQPGSAESCGRRVVCLPRERSHSCLTHRRLADR